MNDKLCGKICLGTAQLGMDYGIANTRGMPGEDSVAAILAAAHDAGVRRFDTAHEYGESEARLGRFMAATGKRFEAVSKAPKAAAGPDELERYCRESLGRLGIGCFDGYLTREAGCLESLARLKEKGLTRATGVSLYQPARIEELLSAETRLDMVEVPYNVFDRRFRPFFEILKERGCVVYARSVFLQGLFFLDPERIRREFPAAEGRITALRELAASLAVPLELLCLGFVLLDPLVDQAVVGVDSPEQLAGNLSLHRYEAAIRSAIPELDGLTCEDEEIIMPTRWKRR